MSFQFVDPSEFQPEEQPEYNATAPLSFEEAESAAARDELDRHTEELRSQHCAAHGTCGVFTMTMFNVADPTKSISKRASCGRFDCPKCFRDWCCKQLRRAANVLCCDNPKSNQLRKGKLFFRVARAEQWDAISKAIRRIDSECGRLRIFTAKDEVIVISETFFPGCMELGALAAAGLVADAVRNAAKQMHAFRMLGRWSDAIDEAPAWEAMKHRRTLPETAKLAVELGATVKRTKRGCLSMLFGNAEAALQFRTALKACPSPSLGENFPIGIDLDAGGSTFSTLGSLPDEDRKKGATDLAEWVPLAA